VLCLEKTGTITTGDLEVVEIVPLDFDIHEAEVILKSLACSSLDKNSTIKAIDNYINCDYYKALEVIPFVSEKKWSGAMLEDKKSYVLGAAEFIYNNSKKELFDKINSIDKNYRVVTLSKSDNGFSASGSLPEGLKPIALVVIKDSIRDNASQTIKFFTEQGVELKIISGDNSQTVERIAASAGVPNSENSVDAATLDSDEKIIEAAEKYTVFGRVTPQQKRKLVSALKSNNHTVAMTGDGVNDVLALKESDCSIAISSGSDAAKNISQLVLVDNDFAHLPEVVAEGRRSINNIQRSASLFIVKTMYSIILAFAFIFISINFPFRPIQLSFTNAFLIGIPSFVLALQPNHNRIKGNFLKNIITRAWPGSLMVVANIFALLFFTGNLSYG
ncbi:MAG: HAD-IC family P-type ATPase, partial [Ruminococcus sp.]|nr:HAD-IC family P-type ATPase [Ruminococcus sp.]